jgi:hypothetical protein
MPKSYTPHYQKFSLNAGKATNLPDDLLKWIQRVNRDMNYLRKIAQIPPAKNREIEKEEKRQLRDCNSWLHQVDYWLMLFSSPDFLEFSIMRVSRQSDPWKQEC